MKTKTRILHIDDNVHDRQLVKDVLQKENHDFEIVEADSREKFEKYLNENNFDLVLSDFNILGFDGLQVLQVVKEKNPDMPVIIVTGTGSEEIAIQAMKMGAADYVIKTVKHIRGLVPTIETVLKHKKTHDDRVRAEKALKESETHFRTLADNGQALIWTSGVDMKCDYFNKPWLKFTGRTLEQELGDGWTEGVHPGDLQHCISVYENSFDRREKFSLEYRLRHISGAYRWVQDDGTPRYNSVGEFIGYIGHCLDITERKNSQEELLIAKEKAEESDQLKTAFLQNISHEIRTPMNAICGFSEMLSKPGLSSENLKSYSNIIINSSNQLLSIVTDILTISSLETKQEKVEIQKICVNNMITELLSVFKTQAKNQNISLYSKLPLNDEQSEIFSDKTKLTQIFTNLIVNALKFIKQGFIEIGYNVKDNELEFYVKDSGIGIKSEKLNEIFDRFRQADISISKDYGGAGLGLTISKAYAELLGGKIWVQSEPGKGSTFYFTIPFKSVGELNQKSVSEQIEKDTAISNDLVHESNQKEMAKQTKKSRTILIAEDEEYNFLLLNEFIYNMNLNILHARDGEETVEMCKTNPDISLILMDIKMPVMDGMAATKLIKKFRPDLPIIAQTAYALAHEIERYKNQGFDDYITKPIKHEKLVELVEKYIKKQ